MGTVADLMVKVGADIGAFKAGMATVNRDVKETGGGFSKLGVAVMGAGVLAAGAVTGLVAFGVAAVEKTTEAGQAAYQMGEKFGLAGQQASEWLTVARHLGVDSDQLGSGFKFLSKNVENLNLTLQSGGKISQLTAQPYRVLGIHIKDAGGHIKGASELMLEMADRFSRMPDGIQKTGLAIKIFGKQGMEMLPVLNMGRKGLEDLMKQGKTTGEVMSGPQVEAAHKMFLAQQKLNSEMTGFTTLVGTALMPVAAQFIGWVTGTAVPGLVAFAKPWVAQLTPAIGAFVGWVKTLLPALKTGFDIFSKLAPFILAVGAAWVLWNAGLLVTEGLQAVIIGVQFVAGLVAIISKVGLLTAAQWLLNLAMDANPIGLITIAIAALVLGIIWAYKNVGWFRFAVNAIGGALLAFGKQLWTDIKPAVDAIATAFGWVAQGVGAFASQFWTDIKPVFDWLMPVLKEAWSWLGKLAQALGLAAPDAAAGGGNFSSAAHARTFPKPKVHRGGGGSVFGGEEYWVGEFGPERFVPKTDGTIIPAGAGGSRGGGGLTVLPMVFSPIPPSREQVAVIKEALRRLEREQR